MPRTTSIGSSVASQESLHEAEQGLHARWELQAHVLTYVLVHAFLTALWG